MIVDLNILFSVVKEHLKVRKVLAQSKPHENSFTAMIVGLGKNSASAPRRNSTPVVKSRRASMSQPRFQIDQGSSDGDQTSPSARGSSKENG